MGNKDEKLEKAIKELRGCANEGFYGEYVITFRAGYVSVGRITRTTTYEENRDLTKDKN